MSTSDPEEDSPEDCEELIIKFLAGKDLYPIQNLYKERREDHDRQYEKCKNKNFANKGAGAAKKYREEMYNEHSTCDAQFINNLHHYKTCDAGSGYHAEPKHYAMDFVAEGLGGEPSRRMLKNLKVFSKNKIINEWLNREDHPKPAAIRRAVSCIDFSLESLVTDENREKISNDRRYRPDFTSTIANIDPSFLPKCPIEVDTSKLLAEISLGLKGMIRRVNTQNVQLGDLRISKVLCSTEDHYAYVLLADFDQQKALKTFSMEFEKWHSTLSEDDQNEFGVKGPTRRHGYFEFVNVVLFLEQYVKEMTAFRRARHICQIPASDEYERVDLYLEIDTGVMRLVESTKHTVRCMGHRWADFPSGIVEVRFWGARSEERVAEHIAAIRRTGVAKVTAIDRVARRKVFPNSYAPPWNSLETVVLQTYRDQPPQPTLTSLFCADKDCMGLCQTEKWIKKPKPVDETPPPLNKLISLRERFHQTRDQNQNIVDLAAYIVPYSDAHQNEKVPEHFARLKFLSNFTGTFGTAVVTYDKALLWTDDVHFRIAQRELDKVLWSIKNKSDKRTETIAQWLRQELPEGAVVGFDPMLMTYLFFLETSSQLISAGIRLVPIASNLIDEFWNNRPYREGDVVKIISMQESGKSPERKLRQLRDELKPLRCTATVITTLDDVMWLLNMRGNDLSFSPLTYSYLFVTLKEAHLFIDLEKIDRDAKAHLTRFDVQVHPYRTVHSFISEWFDEQKKAEKHPLAYLTKDTSQWIGAIFGETHSIIEKSLVKEVKAKKNVMEIGGMREANIRDSVSMVEFLCWVDRELAEKKRVYSEVEMADKLEAIKRMHPSYEGRSCATLFASGKHASRAAHRPDHAHIVSPNHQYLVHSGAHYKNGTSSISRTVWDTSATPEFVENYTIVLKGHIEVAGAQFPFAVTNGSRLDVFAKKSLWMQGREHLEDTGHGVGHCLNMREPQVIVGDPLPENDGVIEAGHVISLEPAFHEPDEYGIRIGNCYETIMEKNKFLGFRPLTLVPIQTSIVVKEKLTAEETLWINLYHYRVFTEIGPILTKEGKMQELEWLQNACKPI